MNKMNLQYPVPEYYKTLFCTVPVPLKNKYIITGNT